MSTSHYRSPCGVALGALGFILGGCGRSSAPPLGTVVRIDTLIAPSSGAQRNIALTRMGVDGFVYFLDTRLGALVRQESHGEDTVTPAGLVKRPTTFAWIRDSLAIIDAANNSVRLFDSTGHLARTILLPRPFGSAVIDPHANRLYISVYSARYFFDVDRFVPGSDSLIEEISLSDGHLIRRIGSPAQFGGSRLQFTGNDVMLAWQPARNSLAIAWPINPHVQIRTADGLLVNDRDYPLTFAPSPPQTIHTVPTPIPPDVDFQQIVYGLDVDSSGDLYVLAAAAAKKELLNAPTYKPPAQVVDIIKQDGGRGCRLELPFFATSIVVERAGSLLLSDGQRGNGAYRLLFDCFRKVAPPPEAT